MRTRFLLALLAIAGNVQAADGTGTGLQVVHVNGSKAGAPMAWRYGLLQTAQAKFEQHVAAQAPGAVLMFRLPKVDPVQGVRQVEIITADKHVSLPMAAAATFTLAHGAEADAGDSVVAVDQYFPKGSYHHPNLQVRSPGLPEGVKRMGDLRLACTAQIAMAKAESFKFRALLMTVGLFADVCAETEVTHIDAPVKPYDTVTIEDGGRTLTLAKSDDAMPRLGNKTWSDNARISYRLNDQVVY